IPDRVRGIRAGHRPARTPIIGSWITMRPSLGGTFLQWVAAWEHVSCGARSASGAGRGAIVVTKERFAQGMTVRQYIDQMSTNKARFLTALDSIAIAAGEDVQLLERFAATRKILVITEDWCVTSLALVPFVVKLAEGIPRIEMRIFLR